MLNYTLFSYGVNILVMNLIKKQEEEYYQAIGKFVVSFEQCCATLRRNIILHISFDSNTIDQTFTQILTNKMTAEDLRSCYISIVNSSRDLNKFEEKVLKNISNRFQKITQIRNEFLHAEWILAQGIFSHGLKIYRRKSKNTSKGQEHLPYNISADVINNYSYEAYKLNSLFSIFHTCINIFKETSEDISAKNFCFENNEVILVKDKNKTKEETSFVNRQFKIIGIKGSSDSGIKYLARNSHDVYYLIMNDYKKKDWSTLASNLESVLKQSKLIEFDIDNILEKGTVILFNEQTKTLAIKVYDWFPNKDDEIPDFSVMN